MTVVLLYRGRYEAFNFTAAVHLTANYMPSGMSLKPDNLLHTRHKYLLLPFPGHLIWLRQYVCIVHP